MFENILGETGGTILQFVLALIVVVLLIIFVLWLIKRLGLAGRGGGAGSQAELQILTSLSVDSKRKLVVVRHGQLEHLLLIGGGSDEVVERSMVGGIPLTARVQAGNDKDQVGDDDTFKPDPLAPSHLASHNARAPAVDPTKSASVKKQLAAGGGALAGVAAAAASTFANKPAKAAPTQSQPDAAIADTTPDWAGDERAALDQSLDDALSQSLFGEPDDDTPPAESLPLLAPKEPLPAFDPPSASKSATEADLKDEAKSSNALERELEAALDLEHFEQTEPDKVDDAPALADLPDMSDLQDTDDGEEETALPLATPATAEAVEPTPALAKTTAEVVAEAATKFKAKTSGLDPLDLASLSEPPTITTPESKPDVDVPVALSGRDTPPIPVPIPTRGPGAAATTLPTVDDPEPQGESEPDDGTDDSQALDISNKLKPTPAPDPDADLEAETDTDDGDESGSDLDDEMRRLLGEIAGEPNAK